MPTTISDNIFSGETIGQINDELWITKDGEFIVPYTGVYEILIIDGGSGAMLNTDYNSGYGGNSGTRSTFIRYLEKDTIISIVIGKGGKGRIKKGTETDTGSTIGTQSYFGNLQTGMSYDREYYYPFQQNHPNCEEYHASGPNNGRTWGGNTTTGHNASFDGIYPGGGGVGTHVNSIVGVGNGADGAIRLRFHNPTKQGLH